MEEEELKITEIIEIIDKHIKIYQDQLITIESCSYEDWKRDGALEALTDIRNEFAREMQHENSTR